MAKSLKGFLEGLFDPNGPIGQWLSPSDVYKDRAGLPVSSPHTLRVALETSASVEHALAPAKFIAAAEANPPKERVRVLSAFVEEVWSPVYAKADTTDMATIVAAAQTLVGWTVTQRKRDAYCSCTKARFTREADGEYRHAACGRARKHLTDEEFVEVMQLQNIVASDEYYNGFYPTLGKGNEPVIENGEVLRGTPTYDAKGNMTHDGIIRGQYIRGGRAEWREKTKGMVLWDEGVVRERQKAHDAEARKPIDAVRAHAERLQGQVLPMRRLVQNPRRDRQSAS